MFQVDSFYFLFWTSCRKLCLVWLFEILDKAVTTGVLPLVSKNISLDSIALSILPSSEWSIHFCQIYTRQFLGQKPNSLLSDSTNSLKHCECKNLVSSKLFSVKLLSLKEYEADVSRNISNTRRMFHQISKHWEVGWNNKSQLRVFNQLWSVWISDETCFQVFDIAFLKCINNSWRENKGNHYREGGLDMWS